MINHFIKNIEIKNFKCFKDFKAEGFGRVNLISGQNNVGKTAFMEAVYLFVNGFSITNFLFSLAEVNAMRNKTDSIIDLINKKTYDPLTNLQQFNKLYLSDNKDEINFKIKNKNGELLFDILAYKEENKSLNKNLVDLGVNIKNISHFIDIEVVESRLLKKFYGIVQLLKKEKYLNEKLNEFDESIERFSFIEDTPMLFKKDIEELIPLNEYGFGSKQLIHYIVALFSMKDRTLFIDEIASGIHYSNLDKLWEIILKISKEQNVQVFATTHSRECIESYARVAKRLEDEDIKYIKMTKLKDGKIIAGVRDYDMLQYTMSDGHEVRGV